MLLAISVLTLLSILILVGLVAYSESKRPPNKIQNFRTRYTDTVWKSYQMSMFIHTFYEVWVKHYGKSRVLRRVLNNLNIHWTDKRWTQDGNLAVAEVLNKTDVKVWRGPRTGGNTYKFNYTALTEAVAQLVVYHLTSQELEFSALQKNYKDFLLEVRDKTRGQESEPNP